jgi:hypothetical protein
VCLGFGYESWLKTFRGAGTEILEMKYPQSQFALHFRTDIRCSECKLAKQIFTFCHIMCNTNRITSFNMIQCNQQMTQGRASTYLHSVTQSFSRVFSPFCTSSQLMMHNKRISQFTSFQHVISTANSVEPPPLSISKGFGR